MLVFVYCAQVAGTYAAEVEAVREVVAALREVEAGASAHNAVDLDVFSASGAFTLSFLDGTSHIHCIRSQSDLILI